MTKTIGCGIVLVGLAVLLGFMGVGQYNGLVGSEQAVSAAWAQVENTYQRRADLIPNLVATVKGSTALRTGDAAGRRRGAQPRRPGERAGDPGDSRQPPEVRPVPAGAGRPLLGALPPVGGGRALSRLEVDRRLQRPDGAARRDREPDHRRAHALQRGGSGVQHAARQASRPTSFVRILGWHFKARPYFQSQAGADTAPKVEF